MEWPKKNGKEVKNWGDKNTSINTRGNLYSQQKKLPAHPLLSINMI
jgi:hypothetical protein